MRIKIQGFIKIHCVSKPEVSTRNTRHERFGQSRAFVVAVYPRKMRGNAIHTYLRQEPLMYFSDAGLFGEVYTYGNIVGHDLASLVNYRVHDRNDVLHDRNDVLHDRNDIIPDRNDIIHDRNDIIHNRK